LAFITDFILVVSHWQIPILPGAVLPLRRTARASESWTDQFIRRPGIAYMLMRYEFGNPFTNLSTLSGISANACDHGDQAMGEWAEVSG
jgi:hypothetical protein